MSFSPTDIACFLAVARLGHVGRAAEARGVSQPAISKALRRLEDAVGVRLFERGAHGARLTAEGQLFLEAAQRLDLQHTEAVRAAADLRARHAGLLRMGVTNASADSAVVRVLSDLVRQRPGLRLQLVVGQSDALNAAVAAGELDLAVVPAYPGWSFSCTQQVLGADPMRPCVRAGHPLLERNGLQLADLAPYGWVMARRQSVSRQLIEQIFEQHAAPAPGVTLEVDYMSDAVMGMVAATDLLAIVPVTVLRSWLGRVFPLPLPALEIARSLVLLSRPGARWSPLMHSTRDALVQSLATKS